MVFESLQVRLQDITLDEKNRFAQICPLQICLKNVLPKTNFLKRSFSYRGAMAWNQLSNETREMGDLTSFKLAIS